ncbi:RluA family pseudouridine synthase [Crocinitomicaceae bacterium]|nr:RluA family pseudouridine synthase [Crocinitomicaceae bacterium]
MIKTKHNRGYFTSFKTPISEYELPEKFTFPFFYEPHILSKIAAKELQEHIVSMDWKHDFGLGDQSKEKALGKMFGVLVVQTHNGDLGYISAFSGKIADSNHHDGFVPPIFDMLAPDGFFKKGMDELMQINDLTSKLLENPELAKTRETFENTIKESKKEIEAHRQKMRDEKAKRKSRRSIGEIEMTGDAFRKLEKKLSKESLMYKHQLKVLTGEWEEKIEKTRFEYHALSDEVVILKKKRKQMSNVLQQKLFDQYNFLNQNGELKNVCAIFEDTALKTPPSAAGECAAPKLLQYAYQRKLKPISMAEFWWGKAPKSEIRKHMAFYPSCRGKCEPILNHMLKGVSIEDNPLLKTPIQLKEPEILFEDEHLLILNKPEGMLSVKGNTQLPSVQQFAEKCYPDAEGPMIIHRLDMATSGILILSKTKKANKKIQEQFIKRTIKKRYVAILEGNVMKDNGTIELPIRQDFNDRPKQLVCYEYGKSAKTQYKVLKREKNRTHIYFYPITGRSHQLRVHAAHFDGLNAPILGDDLYGNRDARLHLHAEYIEFNHPKTGKRIKIKVKADF